MIEHPKEPPVRIDPRAELAKAGFKSPFSFYEGRVWCPHGGCHFPRLAAKVHQSYETDDGAVLLGIECPVCHAHGVLREVLEETAEAA
ncbi:MAG: hypothetical protein D6729_13355 [Deltaproteobacteria bacterium]|nr:MAG: hypothetical protein D6729_13355 [Deltaproteobacteria bacterium]